MMDTYQIIAIGVAMVVPLIALLGVIANSFMNRAKLALAVTRSEKLEDKHDELKAELDAFKVSVAQSYVSVEMMHMLETRLLTATAGIALQVERLGVRMDQLFRPLSMQHPTE